MITLKPQIAARLQECALELSGLAASYTLVKARIRAAMPDQSLNTYRYVWDNYIDTPQFRIRLRRARGPIHASRSLGALRRWWLACANDSPVPESSHHSRRPGPGSATKRAPLPPFSLHTLSLTLDPLPDPETLENHFRAIRGRYQAHGRLDELRQCLKDAQLAI